MRPATKFHRVTVQVRLAPNLHDTHGVTVLVTEELLNV